MSEYEELEIKELSKEDIERVDNSSVYDEGSMKNNIKRIMEEEDLSYQEALKQYNELVNEN